MDYRSTYLDVRNHAQVLGAMDSCVNSGQTYEGGVSGAPQTEAHGAYAFCVLACLCILGPPHEIIPK